LTPRALALAAGALALGALALAGGGAARPAAGIPFEGTVTLKAFDVTKRCGRVAGGSKQALRVRCAQLGAYAGVPSPAGASYDWTWDLEVDAKGFTTGRAAERGKVTLNFGAPGYLYLSLTGAQTPVGRTTATSARGLTRGTWTISKGTAAFVGRHGKGTYRFTTARTNSKSVFSVAKLVLSGSIT
jgi:hypothetical protein